MKRQASREYGTPLLIVGVVVAIWGVTGLFQMGRWAEGGYFTSTDGSVSHVETDGPAESAGLREGDLILAVGSVPNPGVWKKPFLGRVEPGETQTLLLERDGRRMSVQIVWEPITSDVRRSETVDGMVTVAFLGFGIWALLAAGTPGGLLLAVFGITYALTNFSGPSLGLPEGAIDFLQGRLSLFYTALLAHFLLIFPKPKAVLRTHLRAVLFYCPFFAYLAFCVAAGFLYPSLRSEYALVSMATDLFYMVLALGALIHGWFSMPRDERRDSGFNWIPLGLVFALAPFIILALIRILAPEFVLPGEDFLPILGAAIPAGMALAVVKGARLTEE